MKRKILMLLAALSAAASSAFAASSIAPRITDDFDPADTLVNEFLRDSLAYAEYANAYGEDTVFCAAPIAREPIPEVVVHPKPAWWYAQQARAWYDYALELQTDETAWRTCYLATTYANKNYEYNLLTSEVMEQIEKYIPGTYTYYYALYCGQESWESAAAIGEKAIELLPVNPTLKDLDVWLCHYFAQYDEAGMERIAKLHLQYCPYPEQVMAHNLNELNSMEPNSICLTEGDAAIIPKLLIIYGQGKHRDKRVVCISHFANPDFLKNTFVGCGAKEVPELKDVFASQEDFDAYVAAAAQRLAKLSGRQLYYTFMVSETIANELPGSNEGLLIRAGKKKALDFKKFKNNWQNVYAKEVYLTEMGEDFWHSEMVVRAQMAMMAEQWIPEVYSRDRNFADELQEYVDFFSEVVEAQYYNSAEYAIFDENYEEASDDDTSLEESLTQLGESMYAAYLQFLADYNAHRIVEKAEPQGQGENAEEEEEGLCGTITMLFNMLGKEYDADLVKIFSKHIDDYAEDADEE